MPKRKREDNAERRGRGESPITLETELSSASTTLVGFNATTWISLMKLQKSFSAVPEYQIAVLGETELDMENAETAFSMSQLLFCASLMPVGSTLPRLELGSIKDALDESPKDSKLVLLCFGDRIFNDVHAACSGNERLMPVKQAPWAPLMRSDGSTTALEWLLSNAVSFTRSVGVRLNSTWVNDNPGIAFALEDYIRLRRGIELVLHWHDKKPSSKKKPSAPKKKKPSAPKKKEASAPKKKEPFEQEEVTFNSFMMVE